jgi:hypothetical protein
VSYTNITLTDTTNGVSTSLPDASRVILAVLAFAGSSRFRLRRRGSGDRPPFSLVKSDGSAKVDRRAALGR